MGYLEAATGFGLIVGPVIGSILFSIGGFSFTFISFGLLFLVISAMVNRIFAECDVAKTENEDRNQSLISDS